jgi:hypothetical protein
MSLNFKGSDFFSMADDDIAELTAQLSVLQAKLGVHSTGLKLWSV